MPMPPATDAITNPTRSSSGSTPMRGPSPAHTPPSTAPERLRRSGGARVSGTVTTGDVVTRRAADRRARRRGRCLRARRARPGACRRSSARARRPGRAGAARRARSGSCPRRATPGRSRGAASRGLLARGAAGACVDLTVGAIVPPAASAMPVEEAVAHEEVTDAEVDVEVHVPHAGIRRPAVVDVDVDAPLLAVARVDRAERDLRVGRHAHVLGHEHLDLADADLEREVRAPGRQLEVAEVDLHGANPHLVSIAQLRDGCGSKRPVSPRAAYVEVGGGDRGEREREHDPRDDQPAGAATERAADQADPARDDQAGDAEPAAAAAKPPTASASSTTPIAIRAATLERWLAPSSRTTRTSRYATTPAASRSITHGPAIQSGVRIAMAAMTSRPAPTTRATPQRIGGAAGSSLGTKRRHAR